jgi:hypothetical protein
MALFLLIRASVWLALTAWFVGAWCRALVLPHCRFSHADGQSLVSETVYRWSWLLSAAATWVHVLASYGLVHGWDHQAVVSQTAEDSFAATGIRAGWGVYVNFAYAGILLAYSVAMLGYRRRLKFTDSAVFWFTAFIVFNAAIVFKGGALRVITSLAFIVLFAVMFYRRRPEMVAPGAR